MFCENCGEKLPEGARFCQICGVPVKTIGVNNAPAQAQYNNQAAYQQPANRQPINQQPINQQPINQQPINQQQVNQQPINKQPANQQPINQQSINRQQINQQSITQKQSKATLEKLVDTPYEDSYEEDIDPRWPIPVIVLSIFSAVLGIVFMVVYPKYTSSYFYAIASYSLPAVFIPPTRRKPMLTMIPVALFYISLLVPWILDVNDKFGGSHTIVIVGLTVAIIIPMIFQFFFVKKRRTFLCVFMILAGIISVCSHIMDEDPMLGIIYHVIACMGFLLADILMIERKYDEDENTYDGTGNAYTVYNAAFYSLFCPNCGTRFPDDGGDKILQQMCNSA